jgi:hypothetical protein
VPHVFASILSLLGEVLCARPQACLQKNIKGESEKEARIGSSQEAVADTTAIIPVLPDSTKAGCTISTYGCDVTGVMAGASHIMT